MAKSTDHRNLKQNSKLKSTPVEEPRAELPVGSHTNKVADADAADQSGAAPAEKFGTQDRVAKIAHHISKLNTTLLQFQTDNEELRKDPMLKSTHRSTASR